MTKKAAIELSVTAIVILILAIVMLGLGLGFIRGMFTKVATTFEQQIAAEPEPPMMSAADPITLSRESIISHAGETEVVKVGVMNPTSDDWGSEEYSNCRNNFTTQDECPNAQGSPYDQAPIGCYWYSSGGYCSGTFQRCNQFTGTSGNTPLSRCEEQLGCMFNDAGDRCIDATGAAPSMRCSGMRITGKANKKLISQGDSMVFNYIIEIPKGTSEGTYLCEVKMKDYRKDLTVRIAR